MIVLVAFALAILLSLGCLAWLVVLTVQSNTTTEIEALLKTGGTEDQIIVVRPDGTLALEALVPGPPGPAGPVPNDLTVQSLTVTEQLELLSGCIEISVEAGGPISPYLLCTIDSSGRAVLAPATNFNNPPIVGISRNAAVAGEQVRLCVVGHFEVRMAAASSVVPGAYLALSQTAGQDGLAMSTDWRSFGVAQTAGEGGDIVRGLFLLNDSA